MSKNSDKVVVLKVALKGQKQIWRRIAIRGDQTLEDLHFAIFDAFDRDDEHLYSFYFLRPGAKGRNRLQDAVEISHPMIAEAIDASETEIASLELRKGAKFEYLFDFGDSWWHELTVEATDGEPDDGKYPRMVEKKGESPPQYPDLDEEQFDDE